MLEKFRQSMQRMFAGRYGVDQFNKALLWVVIILAVVSMFIPFAPISGILYILSIAGMIYLYVRMFSKNISKRYQENQKYLAMTAGIRRFWNTKMKHWKERKVSRYFRCKKCGQTIRVPAGKGKICITCPKCKNEFVKRT